MRSKPMIPKTPVRLLSLSQRLDIMVARAFTLCTIDGAKTATQRAGGGRRILPTLQSEAALQDNT